MIQENMTLGADVDDAGLANRDERGTERGTRPAFRGRLGVGVVTRVFWALPVLEPRRESHVGTWPVEYGVMEFDGGLEKGGTGRLGRQCQSGKARRQGGRTYLWYQGACIW